MQSLFPAPPSDLTDDDLADLYAYPADRPWVRANFVSSLDGSAQGPDHKTAALSPPADQRLFAVLRSLADLILVGAGTTRVEGYRRVQADEVDDKLRTRLGLAALPAMAVVSRSLDIDADLVEGRCPPGVSTGPADPCPLVVITVESAPPAQRAYLERHARVLVAGQETIDIGPAVDQLVALGFSRILCEGGPTLMHEVVASGRLDELSLTISPQLVGGSHLRIVHGPPLAPPVGLRLRNLLQDDSALYARYVREAPVR